MNRLLLFIAVLACCASCLPGAQGQSLLAQLLGFAEKTLENLSEKQMNKTTVEKPVHVPKARHGKLLGGGWKQHKDGKCTFHGKTQACPDNLELLLNNKTTAGHEPSDAFQFVPKLVPVLPGEQQQQQQQQQQKKQEQQQQKPEGKEVQTAVVRHAQSDPDEKDEWKPNIARLKTRRPHKGGHARLTSFDGTHTRRHRKQPHKATTYALSSKANAEYRKESREPVPASSSSSSSVIEVPTHVSHKSDEIKQVETPVAKIQRHKAGDPERKQSDSNAPQQQGQQQLSHVQEFRTWDFKHMVSSKVDADREQKPRAQPEEPRLTTQPAEPKPTGAREKPQQGPESTPRVEEPQALAQPEEPGLKRTPAAKAPKEPQQGLKGQDPERKPQVPEAQEPKPLPPKAGEAQQASQAVELQPAPKFEQPKAKDTKPEELKPLPQAKAPKAEEPRPASKAEESMPLTQPEEPKPAPRAEEPQPLTARKAEDSKQQPKPQQTPIPEATTPAEPNASKDSTPDSIIIKVLDPTKPQQRQEPKPQAPEEPKQPQEAKAQEPQQLPKQRMEEPGELAAESVVLKVIQPMITPEPAAAKPSEPAAAKAAEPTPKPEVAKEAPQAEHPKPAPKVAEPTQKVEVPKQAPAPQEPKLETSKPAVKVEEPQPASTREDLKPTPLLEAPQANEPTPKVEEPQPPTLTHKVDGTRPPKSESKNEYASGKLRLSEFYEPSPNHNYGRVQEPLSSVKAEQPQPTVNAIEVPKPANTIYRGHAARLEAAAV